MLTTLTIISLDQGKIWKDLTPPLPREDTFSNPEEAPALIESRWSWLALSGLVARLLGSRRKTSQA